MPLTYRNELANELSKIFTKALLKPAFIEHLVKGYEVIQGDAMVSPFDPKYIPELITDMENFIQKYTSSEVYTNLMSGKRQLEYEIVDKSEKDLFIKVINQFSQLMENVETFQYTCCDPIVYTRLNLNYDASMFDNLIGSFAKINTILGIEIIPCILTELYTEYDLRDEKYCGIARSKSESLSFQICSLMENSCKIIAVTGLHGEVEQTKQILEELGIDLNDLDNKEED